MRILAIALLISLTEAWSTPFQWERKADMRIARGEHANAVVNGKIYVFGGLTSGNAGPPEVEVYDPTLDTWTVVSTFPEVVNGSGRDHVTVGHAVYGTEIWFCGGKHGSARDNPTGSTRVDIFNTSDRSWRRGPDLPAKAWSHGTAILGDKIHVVGGGVGSRTATSQHFVLDLTDEDAGWSNAAPVPFAQLHTSAVPVDGQIYLLAGETEHAGHRGINARVQAYDPQTDSWRDVADLPLRRSHHEWATFEHNGRIISAGGIPGSQDEVYEYDPVHDQWRLLGRMESEFVSNGAKIIDGVLYTFGGGISSFFPATKETWAAIVDPVANKPPVAVDDQYELATGRTLEVAAPGPLGNDLDLDGDALSLTLEDEVGKGLLTVTQDGAFRYSPSSGYAGTALFTYRASDGRDLSNLANVTVAVTTDALFMDGFESSLKLR